MSSESIPRETRTYLRFPLSDRIEHWLLVVSFSTLAFTGLAQKFALLSISQWFIGLLGGIEMLADHPPRCRNHHGSRDGLSSGCGRISHLCPALQAEHAAGGARPAGCSAGTSLQPGAQPGTARLRGVLPLARKPSTGRAHLGNHRDGTDRVYPVESDRGGQAPSRRSDPGRQGGPQRRGAAGGCSDSGLRISTACISRVSTRACFPGRVTEEELAHEHPLELAELKAGTAVRPVAPEALAARRRIYIPVAVVVSLLLVVGIGFFITLEDTALATVPPMEDVKIYTRPCRQLRFRLPTPALCWKSRAIGMVGLRGSFSSIVVSAITPRLPKVGWTSPASRPCSPVERMVQRWFLANRTVEPFSSARSAVTTTASLVAKNWP